MDQTLNILSSVVDKLPMAAAIFLGLSRLQHVYGS
jgi:hypothetical protein